MLNLIKYAIGVAIAALIFGLIRKIHPNKPQENNNSDKTDFWFCGNCGRKNPSSIR